MAIMVQVKPDLSAFSSVTEEDLVEAVKFSADVDDEVATRVARLLLSTYWIVPR
jgi:hypothetical protein